MEEEGEVPQGVEVLQQPNLEETLARFKNSVGIAGEEITEKSGGGFFSKLEVEDMEENSPFTLMREAEDMICQQILSGELAGEELDRVKQQYLEAKTLFIDKSSGGDEKTKAAIEKVFGLGITNSQVALYGIEHGLRIPTEILADHHITWAENVHASLGGYSGYEKVWRERAAMIVGTHANGDLGDYDFGRVREVVNRLAPENMRITEDGTILSTARGKPAEEAPFE